MRKSILLILAAILFHSCQDIIYIEDPENIVPVTRSSDNNTESYYYWFEGTKIPLTVNRQKFYVIMESTGFDRFRNCTSKSTGNLSNIKTYENYTSIGLSDAIRSNIGTQLTSFTLDVTTKESVDFEDVIYISPFYKTTDGSDIGITNILSVRLKREQDLISLEKIAQDFNIEILGQNKHDHSIYLLSCTKDSKGNSLEIANYLVESGEFQYATPEFIIKPETLSIPNDTYFNNQWNLNNLSNSTIDINYTETIDSFTFPHISEIIVAIIDTGIATNHEDLTLYDISFDAHTGDSISVEYSGHGTKVAGIIGATTNNNKGIAGIASGVKIMSISFCTYEDAQKLGKSPSTTTQLANAIRFAANKGARIINNSWGSDTSSPMSEINDAITYAHEKGCIVVFASGNDGGDVSQPAKSAPSATLVVGRIGSDGLRYTSSNYGNSLDVVAPGTDILTTNSTGSYSYVDGTSFAAPHVSGIAALIWGRNPNLQAWRVRDIIEQCTKKIGMNSYESQDTRLNGSWNQFYGYGLVDAYSAVASVTGTVPNSPILSSPLSEVTPADLVSMGLEYDIWSTAYVARETGEAIFFIDNYDSSAQYAWTSTLPPYYGSGSSFTVEYSSTGDPELHEIRCQVLKNGLSAQSGVSLAVIPYDYSY